jgi:hypothetical protein
MADYTLNRLETLAAIEVSNMVESKKLKTPIITSTVVHVSSHGAVLQVSFRAIDRNNQLGEYGCGVTL